MDIEIIKVLIPILTTLLAIFAGGFMGYFFASKMWNKQQAVKRQNIARGILLEIQSLEKKLTGCLSILNKSPDGANVIGSPLYPAHGLYHVLQKDLFSFHSELSGALFQFYIRLFEADRLRQDPAFAIMQDGLRATLEGAVSQLPELKTLLRSELGRDKKL